MLVLAIGAICGVVMGAVVMAGFDKVIRMRLACMVGLAAVAVALPLNTHSMQQERGLPALTLMCVVVGVLLTALLTRK